MSLAHVIETSGTDEEVCRLFSLPNEILLQILALLRTPVLLPLSTACRRFYHLIARIHAQRLLNVACLRERILLLKAYHPSQELSERHMRCTYLGTNGLNECLRNGEIALQTSDRAGKRLKQLNGLYSRFRIERRYVEPKSTRKHPAGGSVGVRSVNGATNNTGASGGDSTTTSPKDKPKFEPVRQLADLDSGANFTQVCVWTMLAIPGPEQSLFYGLQDVNKGGKEGKLFLRVFREWLADQAITEPTSSTDEDITVEIAQETTPDEGAKGKEPVPEDEDDYDYDFDHEQATKADKGILWVCDGYNVGIRFGVRNQTRQRSDGRVLEPRDEDTPITYEIQYNELLVRTASLLWASEKLDDQQSMTSGKAIIIGGSWN